MALRHMQIGEVAAQTGLSLRTIRYYEEMDLVVPSARTSGGFRLYTDSDVARLQLIKRMKPLDFTLEETRDLLGNLDALESVEGETARAELVSRLEMYQEAAQARVEAVRQQLEIADGFAADLRAEINRHKRDARARG
ncbi:MerR family transcriptional regulator [Nocardioides sp.]|uniref:MerR family transcriptional regulator n=1 Tax=Nocardioides sp. TaxID=35761 RepID=UPI0027367B27|nr:MerR family transcriptional regulator [Nocardioides sp.]MDP3891784.1 MerR family transcriptional regulator [Nocardioides sp.]